jgi:hypothetical protein
VKILHHSNWALLKGPCLCPTRITCLLICRYSFFLKKTLDFFFTEVDHSFIGDFNVKVICQ